MLKIRIYIPKIGKFWHEESLGQVARKFSKKDLEEANFQLIDEASAISDLSRKSVMHALQSLWDLLGS